MRPVLSTKPSNKTNRTKNVTNSAAASIDTRQKLANKPANTKTTTSTNKETEKVIVITKSDANKQAKKNILNNAKTTIKNTVTEMKQAITDTNKSRPNNKNNIVDRSKSKQATPKANAESSIETETTAPQTSNESRSTKAVASKSKSTEKKTKAQIAIPETGNTEQSNNEACKPLSIPKKTIVKPRNKNMKRKISNDVSKVDGIVPKLIGAEDQVSFKRIPPSIFSTERKDYNHNQKVPALAPISNNPMEQDPNMRYNKQKHTSTTLAKAIECLKRPDVRLEDDTACQASSVQQSKKHVSQSGKISKKSNNDVPNEQNEMESKNALQPGVLRQRVPLPIGSSDISSKAQSLLQKKKKKKSPLSTETPKANLADDNMTKKRIRENRDRFSFNNATNETQSPLQKKMKTSKKNPYVNFADDNTTKKRTRDNRVSSRCTNAANEIESSWSVEEHSRFMFLFFMFGPDFTKIAGCMPSRNCVQIRAYAMSAFNGDSITHWSVDDYVVLVEKVSKQWIQIDGWNKEEVIEKIRKKPALETNRTMAKRRPNSNAKQRFVDESPQTDDSVTESEQDFPSTSFDESTNSAHAPREIFQEPRIDSRDLQSIRRDSVEMNHNDVLLLKRKSRFESETHPGNIQFQELCSSRKEQYSKDNGKKNGIVRTIVDYIASMDPPGRFLKFDRDSDIWFCVSDNEAVLKTHATLNKMKSVPDAKSDIQERVSAVGSRTAKTNFLSSTSTTTPAPPKKYVLELASFNKPPTTEDGDKAFFLAATAANRPKRQRHTVTFFEPNATSPTSRKSDSDDDGDSKETRKTGSTSRKRRREVADMAVDSLSKRSSRSGLSGFRQDKRNEDKRRSSPRKRYRVSQKCTRRLISNALSGFLQRQGTISSTDGNN